MDRIAPIQPPLELQAQTASPEPMPGPRITAETSVSNAELSLESAYTTRTLLVELDKDAGRFVQILTDISTDEVLRQYPSESQLAYSRAVVAYMRALIEA